MIAFFLLCPDTAFRETRTIHVPPDDIVPEGEYALIDMYCDESDCDCRRSVIQVLPKDGNGPVATFNYGWESPDFYERWALSAFVENMAGFSIEPLGKQSEFTPYFYELVKSIIEQDPEYASRFPRHYYEFKAAIKNRGQNSHTTPYIGSMRRYQQRKKKSKNKKIEN